MFPHIAQEDNPYLQGNGSQLGLIPSPFTLWTHGNIFDCPNGGKDATGIQWVEARDAVKHPTIHRRVPQGRFI